MSLATAAAELDVRYLLVTPPTPGAIAIIQLHGPACEAALSAMTGEREWPVGRVRLVRFGDIDEGLAGRVTGDCAQLMPHGGARVVQRMLERLQACGVQPVGELPSPEAVYVEAGDRYEALMLSALARATSSLAITPLLAQPAIWRANPTVTDDDVKRSRTLDRLLSPPMVVVAGPPNVGKSTLSNALVGRNMSISLDMPGTTRDYTSAQVDAAGLVVHWHDTPGLRDTTDPIEQRAIEMARRLIARADLLIAMTDTEHDWPLLDGRAADVRVGSKADVARRVDADVNISAATGEGVRELIALVRDTLVPSEQLGAARVRPWLFDARLMENDA